MIEQFLQEMYRHAPPDAAVLMSQFRGDPTTDMSPRRWVARPVRSVHQLDEKANVYFTVSLMGKNAAGEYRRRKENFVGGVLLMIDDLGSGPGSKFPMATIDKLEPTALIETSPDNYQAVYFFDRLVTNPKEFDALIKTFIEHEFLGNDPGMSGVNRVFRPPFGVNGKAKHNNHTVRCVHWHPNNRYSPSDIARAFDLTLHPPAVPRPRHATKNVADEIRHFIAVREALRAARMLKRNESNLGGWIDVRCPWTHEHSGSVDNGAAIAEPSEDNGWTGAFRCHHGSCMDRGWRDLTEWLANEQGDLLAHVNAHAKRFEDYVQ